jgi:hypothetical protein
LIRLDSAKEMEGFNLDFVALDLDFVAPGLDFVANNLGFVPADLDFHHRAGAGLSTQSSQRFDFGLPRA